MGSIIRVNSFLFGCSNFIDALLKLHADSVANTERKKGLKFHFFEQFSHQKKAAGQLHRREALALLSGKEYVPKKVTLPQRVKRVEAFFRSETSRKLYCRPCSQV